MLLFYIVIIIIILIIADVDEVSPTEADYGIPNLVIKRPPRPHNTLSTINLILLRKSATNKLSR